MLEQSERRRPQTISRGLLPWDHCDQLALFGVGLNKALRSKFKKIFLFSVCSVAYNLIYSILFVQISDKLDFCLVQIFTTQLNTCYCVAEKAMMRRNKVSFISQYRA